MGARDGLRTMNRDRFPLPLDLRNLSDGSKEHWVTLAHFAYRDDDWDACAWMQCDEDRG